MSREARTIYLATDDPETVKKEISKLPRGQGDTVIVGGEFVPRGLQQPTFCIAMEFLIFPAAPFVFP